MSLKKRRRYLKMMVIVFVVAFLLGDIMLMNEIALNLVTIKNFIYTGLFTGYIVASMLYTICMYIVWWKKNLRY